jgi:aryl carrier-like protein
MGGYLNNAGANAHTFVNGWFRTGDLGFLDSDGYLFISGRIKEVINRGGEKIAPREVEDVLMGHPAVAQVVAFAVPDDQLGEEVAAAVVLREGTTASPMDLRRFVQEHLAPFKVPRHVVILDEIPRGATGKVQRIGLAEKLGLTGRTPNPSGEREYVAARTPDEEILVELWCEVLRVGQVGVHDAFLDLGGDSILAMMLLARVKARFGVDLSMVDFFDAPTVAEQARLIDSCRLAPQGGETRLGLGPKDLH